MVEKVIIKDATLYCGDCREVLPNLDGVAAVVTDPPCGGNATHDKHLSSITLRSGEPAGQALGFDGITCDEMVQLAQARVSLATR